MWNVRTGSLMTPVKELSKYKLGLVGIQEVIRNRGGTEPYTYTYTYTFSMKAGLRIMNLVQVISA
jgi:hypothetical protein